MWVYDVYSEIMEQLQYINLYKAVDIGIVVYKKGKGPYRRSQSLPTSKISRLLEIYRNTVHVSTVWQQILIKHYNSWRSLQIHNNWHFEIKHTAGILQYTTV